MTDPTDPDSILPGLPNEPAQVTWEDLAKRQAEIIEQLRSRPDEWIGFWRFPWSPLGETPTAPGEPPAEPIVKICTIYDWSGLKDLIPYLTPDQNLDVREKQLAEEYRLLYTEEYGKAQDRWTKWYQSRWPHLESKDDPNEPST